MSDIVRLCWMLRGVLQAQSARGVSLALPCHSWLPGSPAFSVSSSVLLWAVCTWLVLLPIMHCVPSPSPSWPLSICHHPLRFLFLITLFHISFPFSPHPRSDPYTPSWCFHHERMNPQVPHPALLKGKGSQGVGDIDPLKLYDRC